MKTFTLENKPAELKKAQKTAKIFVKKMEEPFQLETQEGLLTYSPETTDDWEDGYVIAYTEDGSKPYAMSQSYFRDCYEYVQ